MTLGKPIAKHCDALSNPAITGMNFSFLKQQPSTPVLHAPPCRPMPHTEFHDRTNHE
jgi:hypothetical protein